MATASPPPARIPECFDPYLRHAIETDFRDYQGDRATPQGAIVSLLIEMKAGANAAIDDRPARYVSIRCESALLREDWFVQFLEPVASRVELSQPITPLQGNQAYSNRLSLSGTPATGGAADALLLRLEAGSYDIAALKDATPGSPGPSPQSGDPRKLRQTDDPENTSLLLGVIDDGCPFAHPSLLRAGQETRIVALWDQGANDLARFEQGGTRSTMGVVPPDFTYGVEYSRAAMQAIGGGGAPGQTVVLGLNQWIQQHSEAGSIREDALYMDGGFTSLRSAYSHGAHVLDVLAGPVSLNARADAMNDHRIPATGAPDELVRKADIAFVQIPRGGINDASGRWLGAHIFDGLLYILSCASEKTRHVVVNVSYGPTTGPHDGISVLERAMRALTRLYNGENGKPLLEIVLAAGNSYEAEAHVQFDLANDGDSRAWTWQIPPDNSVPSHAEVWAYVDGADPSSPKHASSFEIELLDPAGVPVPDGVKVRNWRSSVCWTLFVGPTSLHCRHATRVPAPHGNWTIRVTRKRGADVSATVHAYLSRAHPNLGARTGARDSRFVDPEWESKAGGRTLLHPERIPVPGQSIVERNGTLSGIATGSTAANGVPTRVYVAGSVRAVDGRKARYSSVGPAREGSADPFGRPPGFMRRDGPDACFPTDETWALQGTPGAGNRAGTVFRLIGTSAAAPQLARWLANRPPSSRNPPVPDQLSGIAPCGGP